MPKSPTPDELARRISQLRSAPLTPEAREDLRRYLTHKSNLVVSKSAEAIASLNLSDLSADLETAFYRFFDTDDKGCLAKIAIAIALNHLSTGSESLFLRAIRHTQPEPSFGGPSDSAGPLRAVSALALASLGSRHALTELSDLLMDPLPPCRIAAARALAHVNHESGSLPLRVKILAGDPEIEVLEECLTSLALLTPRPAVPFLERLLDHPDDALKSAASLSLGSTRTPEALSLLLARWQRDIHPASRQRLLPAIAITRLPVAFDFLIDLVASAHPSLAEPAIGSLAPYRHDSQLRARLMTALESRRDPALQTRFNSIFGT